jgi:hypothetical protein
MRYVKHARWFAALWLTILAFIACMFPAASQVTTTPTASPAEGSGQPATFTDPFAYCAAVGTIDAPDSRDTGPKVPEVVVHGVQQAFGAPLGPVLHQTFWRCLDGQVYACTVGAHMSCQERADVSRHPTPGMTDFCQNNPHAEVIPAVATGRATVYEWTCAKDRPAVVRPFTQPDVRGFLSHIWYAISPNP